MNLRNIKLICCLILYNPTEKAFFVSEYSYHLPQSSNTNTRACSTLEVTKGRDNSGPVTLMAARSCVTAGGERGYYSFLGFFRIAYTQFLKLGPCLSKLYTQKPKPYTQNTKILIFLAKSSTTSKTI